MYTAHLPSENMFFEAYHRVINTGIDGGQLPRLRLRMIESEADE